MSKKQFKKDALGNRMKCYESVNKTYLPKRMPVIVRIDGNAFHTYTKGFDKPFDNTLLEVFWETCKYLGENVMGAKLIYHQSDEISILIRNDDNLETEPWFDNSVEKIVSLTASLATAKFNELMRLKYPEKKLALFDSRVFILPEDEVSNYFKWRQMDAMRNSISMVAQSEFSHKSLQGLNSKQLVERLAEERNIHFYDDIEVYKQRGAVLTREENELGRHVWTVDKEMPNLLEDDSVMKPFVKLG